MSLIKRLPAVRGNLREDVELAKFCWFQVGGRASVLYKPKDIEDLQEFMGNLSEDIPYFIFGVGSNLLIKDTGFDGVAIRLGREFNFANKLSDNIIHAGAATLDINIANFAAESEVAGLEFFAGIPGTIGGALAMNAGAYGIETRDVLISARAVARSGELREFETHEILYHYRGKGLKDEWVFVDAKFKGYKSDKADIISKIEQIQNDRNATQPVKAKTGGSTFKNPEGHKAWQLIDQAGCRGLVIGGAAVSELHCNFFVNLGDATASNVLDLIAVVKERVYETSGIVLEEEIKIIYTPPT